MSLRAYAREHNVTVWQAIKACPPSRYNARKRDVRDIASTVGAATVGEALQRLVDAGMTQREVAEKFDVTLGCVRYQAMKWGIVWRSDERRDER